MADNVEITEGSGTNVGADEIAGIKYQRVKVIVGADGTNDGDIASGNPMPVVGTMSTVGVISIPTASTALIGSVLVSSGALPLNVTGSTVIVGTPSVIVPTGSSIVLGTVLVSSGVLPLNVTGSTSVIASVLPAGASTAASQSTINTSINSLLKPASTLAAVTAITNPVTITGSTEVLNVVAVTIPTASTANIGTVILSNGTLPINVTGSTTIVGTVTSTIPSAIKNGYLSCPTGSTTTVGTSVICKKLFIAGEDTNTGKVHIGGSTVSTASGLFIYPGATMEMEISDLSAVHLSPAVDGDGVFFTYTE